MLTPFLRKMGPKIAIFRGFVNFFQNYWIATQVRLFILIESPNIFQEEVVVIEIPERKFNANVIRNTIFAGN